MTRKFKDMFRNHDKKSFSDKIIRKSKESASKLSVEVPNISYRKLFQFASRQDQLLIALALVVTVISGSVVPYALTVIGGIFQRMIDYAKDSDITQVKNDQFMQTIYKFGIQYSMFGCIYLVGGYIGTAFLNLAAINQVFRIREAYLKATLNQDFAYFDSHQTGDFASKMADDMIKLEDGIGDKLAAVVYNVTVSVGCVAMALVRGWKLALFCLATTPVTFLLVGITFRLAQRLTKQATAATSSASAVAEAVISSIRTVMAFSGQQKELDRYRRHLREARRTEVRKDLFTGLSNGLLYVCVFSSYALCFYLGTYLIVHDPENYDAGTMYEVFFGMLIGMSTLGMLAGLLGSIASARGANLQRLPHFSHESDSNKQVLKGVSISVKRGQSAALVGHSGCGKSTVVQLVSRYYDVDEGSVSVDGHDVRDVSVVWLRAQVGLVGQEPVLFNTSVRENIRYGREGASDGDVEAAARQANAHHFIARLPNGYETQVGQSGSSLSGGQKQRIAIARALVRNPAILLLDEATSALDLRSEAKVQLALDKASRGRTTLIVAHRLSTIRHADVIYVMNAGSVVEMGSHDELLALKGHYYGMLSLQEPVNVDPPLAPTGSCIDGDDSLTTLYNENGEQQEVNVGTEGEESHPPLSFWRVVALNRPEWRAIAVGAVAAIFIGAAMPLFVLVYGNLYGALSITDQTKMMELVVFCGLMFVAIGFVTGLSTFIQSVSFGWAGARLTERLRARMFAHLLRAHAAFFDHPAHSTGALCARLSAEAAYVQNATGERIGVMLQGISSVAIALTLALCVEWRIALVAMSFFPLLGLIAYYQGKATLKDSFKNAAVLENSTKIAVEAVLNVRTVQSLGRQEGFVRAYASQLRGALPLARLAAHLRGVVTGLTRSLFTFINAAAITYGGHLMVTDKIQYQNIIIAAQALQMVSAQVQTAFTYAPDCQKGVNAAARAVALLNTPVLIEDPETPVVTGFQATGDANFDNVEFGYPTRPADNKVLSGLDLEIARGKTIALVGRSGEGKSTVISLLQRYYDPDSGVVVSHASIPIFQQLLDGHPLPRLLLGELRATYGLVAQEPVLFDRSVAENIAYGDNARQVTRDEVIAAAQLANIHGFIVTLPEGYDSNIGAKGVKLSGGQKQRIAIARALVRRPAILLLDEATSALDTESEKVVQEALDRAKAGRTCVMIAHRLSTVREADAICVVSEGRVAEKGTHAQLMELKGLYYELNRH